MTSVAATSPTVNGRLAAPHSPIVSTFHTQQMTPPHHQSAVRKASSSHSPLLGVHGSPLSPPAAAANHHPGCVLCGYVASAGAQFLPSAPYVPSSPVGTAVSLPSPARSPTPDLYRAGPSNKPFPSSPTLRPLRLPQTETLVSGHRIIYRDDAITVYPAEGKEALCPSGRHLIIVINRHLTNVYDLGPYDVPLLSHMVNTAHRLLLARHASSGSEAERRFTAKDVRVGFVNGMPADPRSPHAHLHAHAFLGPFDKTLPGSTLWRRNIVFSYLNWWELEDLRAEIREETSNNRVKSGYDSRLQSPIDKVPDAGAREGLPNALDPDEYADGDDALAHARRKANLNRKDSAQSNATIKALKTSDERQRNRRSTSTSTSTSSSLTTSSAS